MHKKGFKYLFNKKYYLHFIYFMAPEKFYVYNNFWLNFVAGRVTLQGRWEHGGKYVLIF